MTYELLPLHYMTFHLFTTLSFVAMLSSVQNILLLCLRTLWIPSNGTITCGTQRFICEKKTYFLRRRPSSTLRVVCHFTNVLEVMRVSLARKTSSMKHLLLQLPGRKQNRPRFNVMLPRRTLWSYGQLLKRNAKTIV